MTFNPKLNDSLQRLEDYLRSVDYQGYDCYDALNSPIVRGLSFGTKHLRIAWIQLFKRLPLNLRPLFMTSRGYNPKGLGLCLSAVARLHAVRGDEIYLKMLRNFDNLLFSMKSQPYTGHCWGYNFDWQSRVFFVPKYTPTIVNSVFVAHGYLDAFEATGEQKFLENARGTCDFILKDLHHTTEDGDICFSYTPHDKLKVHNANLLGAGLLARVHGHTREDRLAEYSLKSARYSVKYQREDGSWFYAETDIQNWIDSFHTGFNLESLDYCARYVDQGFEENIQRGFRFFVENFFKEDGAPKYYHDQLYPVDIHSSAQGIVTLHKLKRYDARAAEVLTNLTNWTLTTMQDRRGYFYFQKRKHYTNRIPYIRWSQAWMYYALASAVFYTNQSNSSLK